MNPAPIDENKLRLQLLRVLAPKLVAEIIADSREDAPTPAPSKFTEEEIEEAARRIPLMRARRLVSELAGRAPGAVRLAEYRGKAIAVAGKLLDDMSAKDRARIANAASEKLNRKIIIVPRREFP